MQIPTFSRQLEFLVPVSCEKLRRRTFLFAIGLGLRSPNVPISARVFLFPISILFTILDSMTSNNLPDICTFVSSHTHFIIILIYDLSSLRTIKAIYMLIMKKKRSKILM